MYDLLEYSDNDVHTSAVLYQFKRDEQNMTDAGNLDDVTAADVTPFKCKSSFLGESTAAGTNRAFKDIKIVVPLKYLSNFFRSLEMPLCNV